MINERVEKEALQRLSRIEGQIRGLQKMIKERRYCIDVVMQILAAEAALHKVSEIVLKNHLETCVLEAFRSTDKREREKKVEELIEVYGRMRMR